MSPNLIFFQKQSSRECIMEESWNRYWSPLGSWVEKASSPRTVHFLHVVFLLFTIWRLWGLKAGHLDLDQDNSKGLRFIVPQQDQAEAVPPRLYHCFASSFCYPAISIPLWMCTGNTFWRNHLKGTWPKSWYWKWSRNWTSRMRFFYFNRSLARWQ